MSYTQSYPLEKWPHSKGCQIFFDSTSLSSGLHRPNAGICRPPQKMGMGRKDLNSPALHQEVLNLRDTMLSWRGRVMEVVVPVQKLYSDASNFGWAGVDVSTRNCIQEFWRGNDGLHINVRELHAATTSVKSLAKEGEKVHLMVDNSVAASYLRKKTLWQDPFCSGVKKGG